MYAWQGQTTFNFTWTQVIQGFWCRYPNPNSQHVLTEDVLETKLVGDKLYVKKLIMKKGKVPSYLQRFTGGTSNITLIEETELDMEAQTLTSYTRNIDMQNIMCVHEKCDFSAENSETMMTVCNRGVFSSSNVPTFGNLIASFGVQQYQKNINSTTKGFNYVLNTLFNSEFQERVLTQQQCIGKRNYLVEILKTIHSKVKTMIFQYRNTRLVCTNSDLWMLHHFYGRDFI